MDDITQHLKEIKKILADEQIGGDFADTIKNFFNKHNIEIHFISSELENLKGKDDTTICKWAKENGYDAILTEDTGMVFEAAKSGLKVFQVRHLEKHKKLMLLRIYKLKTWAKTIIEEE